MQLQRLAPILWTKDLQQTVSFYENALGFKSRSNFPNFASLYKDTVEIMVIVPTPEPDDCEEEGKQESFFPKPCLTGSIFIFMSGVNEFWQSVKDKATIKTSIADREYGMRDFSIIDNNRYEIVFGEDISSQL